MSEQDVHVQVHMVKITNHVRRASYSLGYLCILLVNPTLLQILLTIFKYLPMQGYMVNPNIAGRIYCSFVKYVSCFYYY
jgi:hypothetical protein